MAITNSRLVGLDDGGVTIRHKERASGRWLTAPLSGHEFMRRFHNRRVAYDAGLADAHLLSTVRALATPRQRVAARALRCAGSPWIHADGPVIRPAQCRYGKAWQITM